METNVDFDNEDWKICDDTIKLIKSNIKGMTDYLGNSVYMK
jgi:hypothetical protein